MIKIVADKHIPFLKGVLDQYADVIYVPGEEIKNLDLSKTDVLITRSRTYCNKELLNNTRIKLIASATIGIDHIDTEYCKNNGIRVKNAPGCNSASVCQYIITALCFLSEKLKFSLQGKTIGIVGHGNVGSKVASFAKIMGMNVLINDPPKQRLNKINNYVSIEEIIKKSDIISLHVPLTHSGEDKTINLIDKNFLSKMSASQILINSSRGGVVEEDSLKIAFNEQRIAGIVLDVWKNEPDIDREILDKSIIGTPHIAGYSIDGKANGTAMVVKIVSDFFKLGINNWFPDNLPCPEDTIILPEISDNDDEVILKNIIAKTYDIHHDNNQLKLHLEKFEFFRHNHPIRREFPVFTVQTSGLSKQLIQKLKKLGFNLIPGISQ
ncbi:4-phosphoerythronate dehydrogenase [Bacteroidota bacterium]